MILALYHTICFLHLTLFIRRIFHSFSIFSFLSVLHNLLHPVIFQKRFCHVAFGSLTKRLSYRPKVHRNPFRIIYVTERFLAIPIFSASLPASILAPKNRNSQPHSFFAAIFLLICSYV